MKTNSIRELHLKTGRWVRHAASRGPIVVTDRGRRLIKQGRYADEILGAQAPG